MVVLEVGLGEVEANLLWGHKLSHPSLGCTVHMKFEERLQGSRFEVYRKQQLKQIKSQKFTMHNSLYKNTSLLNDMNVMNTILFILSWS